MMLSPVPVPAAEPGGSSSQTWCCAGAWGVRGGRLAGKSRAIICKYPAFNPPSTQSGLLGGWEEHMHGKYKLCRKKKNTHMMEWGGTVQERTSQGLLQQQLGSVSAET